MKKIYNLILILTLPFVLILFSYSGGSPGGKTGSTGDGGSTCTGCHSGTAQPQSDWISTNIPELGFIPGETYTITATGVHEDVVKFGFELTAEDPFGDKMGTFTITEASRTKLANANKSVTHTAGGNTPSGDANTWTMDWTAPNPAPATIVFNAAFNAANGNGSTSGDVIYTTELSVSQQFVGLADNEFDKSINIFPNPAIDNISINAPLGTEYTMVDLNGRQVLNSKTTAMNSAINLTGHAKGMYFINFTNNGSSTTKKVILR